MTVRYLCGDLVLRSGVKKPYRKPALKEYGKLEDLTAGGTGHAQEPGNGSKPRP